MSPLSILCRKAYWRRFHEDISNGGYGKAEEDGGGSDYGGGGGGCAGGGEGVGSDWVEAMVTKRIEIDEKYYQATIKYSLLQSVSRYYLNNFESKSLYIYYWINMKEYYMQCFVDYLC